MNKQAPSLPRILTGKVSSTFSVLPAERKREWRHRVSDLGYQVLTVVMLLALVAVVILLALPASNEFFRKEQEVWVPPTAPDLATFPPPLSVPQQSFPSAPESLPPAATPAPEPPVAQPPSAPPPSDPPANTPPSAPQT